MQIDNQLFVAEGSGDGLNRGPGFPVCAEQFIMTLRHRIFLAVFGFFAFIVAAVTASVSIASTKATFADGSIDSNSSSSSQITEYGVSWKIKSSDPDKISFDGDYDFSAISKSNASSDPIDVASTAIYNLIIVIDQTNIQKYYFVPTGISSGNTYSIKDNTPTLITDFTKLTVKFSITSSANNNNFDFKSVGSYTIFYSFSITNWNDSAHGESYGHTRTVTVSAADAWSSFNNLLSKNTALTASVVAIIYSGAATIFARIIMSVFKFGVIFKSNFVTKEEMQEFQRSTQSSLSATAHEIQDSVLVVCQHQIDKGLEPVKELSKTKTEVDSDIAKINMKYQEFSERYDEMKRVSQSVVSLSGRVARIESGGTITEGSRRKDV
jgi:hypothetical protein